MRSDNALVMLQCIWDIVKHLLAVVCGKKYEQLHSLVKVDTANIQCTTELPKQQR